MMLYPLLKAGFHLDFGKVGLITFVFQGTASLLRPAKGRDTDRRPLPASWPPAWDCRSPGSRSWQRRRPTVPRSPPRR
ncbi:hypothetical protein [Methylorubrum populi]|nr:hypothetical protein [Methylorubrum populi]